MSIRKAEKLSEEDRLGDPLLYTIRNKPNQVYSKVSILDGPRFFFNLGYSLNKLKPTSIKTIHVVQLL